MFRAAVHKLLSGVCWNFWPFLLTGLVELGQVCRLSRSQMQFQCRPQLFYRTEVFGLCDGPVPRDVVCFVKCTSFSCSPTIWCCHPHTWRFSFCLIRLKRYDFCIHAQLQTVMCLFLWWVWSSGFSCSVAFQLMSERHCFLMWMVTPSFQFQPASLQGHKFLLSLTCTYLLMLRIVASMRISVHLVDMRFFIFLSPAATSL